MTRTASAMSRVFRTETRPRGSSEIDSDVRRLRVELDAIRARFPDHS